MADGKRFKITTLMKRRVACAGSDALEDSFRVCDLSVHFYLKVLLCFSFGFPFVEPFSFTCIFVCLYRHTFMMIWLISFPYRDIVVLLEDSSLG